MRRVYGLRSRKTPLMESVDVATETYSVRVGGRVVERGGLPVRVVGGAERGTLPSMYAVSPG